MLEIASPNSNTNRDGARYRLETNTQEGDKQSSYMVAIARQSGSLIGNWKHIHRCDRSRCADIRW
jgi:hypothetical protein